MPVSTYLSFGSNLGDREGNLRHALTLLEPDVHVRDVSSLYETEPVGVLDQPRFLNLVARAETDLPPGDLLRRVKDVERRVGRRPTPRWGPRVIDIDILLYGDLVVEEPTLSIPHREMRNRAFVLVPLAEIAPDVRLPPTNEKISDLAAAAPGRETLVKLDR